MTQIYLDGDRDQGTGAGRGRETAVESPAATGHRTPSWPSSRGCDYADLLNAISARRAGLRTEVGITRRSA